MLAETAIGIRIGDAVNNGVVAPMSGNRPSDNAVCKTPAASKGSSRSRGLIRASMSWMKTRLAHWP